MEIIAAKPPVTEEILQARIRKPAKLPSVVLGEKLDEYLLLMKEDSPVESLTILGLGFQKFWLPPEASLLQNAGRFFAPRYISIPLSEAQAAALADRAKEIDVAVPQRRNPKWYPDDKDSDEQEFLPAFTTTADKLIIIAKKDSFNPYAKAPVVPENPAEDVVLEKTDEQNPDAFREALYKEQKKAKK